MDFIIEDNTFYITLISDIKNHSLLEDENIVSLNPKYV